MSKLMLLKNCRQEPADKGRMPASIASVWRPMERRLMLSMIVENRRCGWKPTGLTRSARRSEPVARGEPYRYRESMGELLTSFRSESLLRKGSLSKWDKPMSRNTWLYYSHASKRERLIRRLSFRIA